MTTAERRQTWVLEEIVIRGQLDHGSHPERYLKCRTIRTKPFRRFRRKHHPTSILPSLATSGVTVRRFYNQEPSAPYHRITDAELQNELAQIFHIRERLIDAHSRLKKENPQLWLKKGWRGFFLPVGYRYPMTPKVRRVPIGYLTPFQRVIKAKFEAAKKARPPPLFMSHEYIHPRWKVIKYWLLELFPPVRHYAPVTFARVSDFNENDEVDPSRKHYEFPEFRPDIKRKIPSLYDDATHSILAKYLNLRRYHLQYGDCYQYTPTYKLDKRVFPRWKSKSIEKLRRHFEVHDPTLTGFVTYENMCKILDVFGDTTPDVVRRREFDGFVNFDFDSPLTPKFEIEFEEFLRVFYILKYEVPVIDPQTIHRPIRIQLGVRRNTPYNRIPWKSLKDRKRPDIRSMPVSFRKGTQCAAVAVGYSIHWNLASGMF